ncbi:MAG: hypothetical protein FWE67_13440 [Planctomycetaceae bacterium]|nr:hypothetical protein [Planctomycetaceae bacterium]
MVKFEKQKSISIILLFFVVFLIGGTVSMVLAEEKTSVVQSPELTGLLLKDMDFSDAEFTAALKLAGALKSSPQLKQLTLRRLPKITFIPKIDTLRNLSLIELNITGKMFDSILEMKDLTALDLRFCCGITPEQYKRLNLLPKLKDLKIGGYTVNDEVLKTITPLPNLTGLTLDDTAVTAKGLADYIERSPSAKTLQMFVLNKGTLTDDDLLPLNRLPKLTRLVVSDSMVSGSFLGKWAADETTRPKLNRLSLKNTLLNEENAEHLKKYKELSETILTGTIAEATSK